jgi:hypothetical protein
MLLTITGTRQPATDLGYLLHKNPARSQSFELPVGMAHVFYPEASDERCTVAMLLEIDPVGLVRGEVRTLREYVNDRPYAASSFLSVALSRVFGTALGGKSKERPDLALTPLPLASQDLRAAVPRWRRLLAAVVRTAWLLGAGREASARRRVPRVGREPVLHGRTRGDSEPSVRWRSGSSPSAWRPWNDWSVANHSTGSTNASSACSPWRANRSTRDCRNPGFK